MFSCLHPWVIDWSVTGPSNCLILKLLLVIFSLQTSLPGYNKRPSEAGNPQNVLRDIMESYFSKKMNVIGKYILEKLTKCTFSSLSGTEGRQGRKVPTHSRETRMLSFVLLSSPFRPLFGGERGRNVAAQFRSVGCAQFQQGSEEYGDVSISLFLLAVVFCSVCVFSFVFLSLSFGFIPPASNRK